MRGSKKDLPLAEDYGERFRSYQAEWGGMIVEISIFPAGVDCTPLFAGLPDNRCQSEHWGYVLEGRVAIKYIDREEVFEAGDAYYIEPGHVPFFEEDTEVVEFSPKAPYQETLDVAAGNIKRSDTAMR